MKASVNRLCALVALILFVLGTFDVAIGGHALLLPGLAFLAAAAVA